LTLGPDSLALNRATLHIGEANALSVGDSTWADANRRWPRRKPRLS
jgi:hypothetical protein